MATFTKRSFRMTQPFFSSERFSTGTTAILKGVSLLPLFLHNIILQSFLILFNIIISTGHDE